MYIYMSLMYILLCTEYYRNRNLYLIVCFSFFYARCRNTAFLIVSPYKKLQYYLHNII